MFIANPHAFTLKKLLLPFLIIFLSYIYLLTQLVHAINIPAVKLPTIFISGFKEAMSVF